MSIEEEFGAFKERLRSMPTHDHLIDMRKDIVADVNRVADKLGEVLKEDKKESRDMIDRSVKRHVENAFSLLWDKVETKVATEIANKIPPPALPPPPKRDWMPYIIVIGMILAGVVERGWPYIMRKFG
jgi:hypothetical protein